MSLLRILTRIKAEPWAITPEYMDTILQIAQRENMDPEAVAQKLGRPLENSYAVEVRDGVAILPVHGPLFRYASMFDKISGATSYQMLGRDFAQAVEDPSIDAIVLDVNSPGGEADGVSEFADQIYQARGTKPILAYVGGQASSAAYWIASAADEIVLGDTAFVGSIGTVLGLTDTRERDAKAGVKRIEIVSSQSPHKRIDPATDSGRGRLQVFVDSLSDVFIDKVARNRGVDRETVLKDFGQGDVIVGQAAVGAGMADRIGSFEGVIAELTNRGAGGVGTTIAAAGGNSSGDREGMSYYLTNQPPAAGDDQRQMEATAENISRLLPDVANALREEGATAKAKAMGDGVKTERERISAILTSDEAEGRRELANHLAFETDMTAEAALALLAKSPKEAAIKEPVNALAAAMEQEPNPNVGADAGGDGDDIDAAIARSQALGKQLGVE